jgi:sporulation inhibitor KapD
MKKFTSYIQEGLFVYLNVSDESTLHGKCKAFEIISFVKMIRHRQRKPIVFFDLSTIKRGVSNIINRPQNRMFLDMEFTMPPYNYDTGKPFASEVIQYGFYIEDEAGNVIDSDQSLVRPVFKSGLNERTFDFLSLKLNDFKKAISYKAFYIALKEVIDRYDPVIYVWGKNDIIVLEKSYELHQMEPLTHRDSFVNLMQIIKNYYNIRNDIGLFNALTLFKIDKTDEQEHDALNDAMVTLLVFHAFKDYINKRR